MKLALPPNLVRLPRLRRQIDNLIFLGPLHSAIDIVEVQFSGTLAYTETGHLYIDIGEDGVRYFGNPSPEVDQAWRNLIGGGCRPELHDEILN
jgi:hypothetical protein